MSSVKFFCLSAFAVSIPVLFGTPAHALTMQECSAKYQTAKQSNSLNGMDWNAFRQAECGSADGQQAAAATSEAPASTAGKVAFISFKECGAKYQQAKKDDKLGGRGWDQYRQAECGHTLNQKADKTQTSTTASLAPQEAPAGVTFPATIAAAFTQETPSKARMRTCLQQYHANKEAGTLSGLRWIQKGGGYYSLCNKKLKAATGA